MLGLRPALMATAAAAVLISGVAGAAPARAQNASVPAGHYIIRSGPYGSNMEVAPGNRVVGSHAAPQPWDVQAGANNDFTIRSTQTPTGGYLALNGAQAVVGSKPILWAVEPAGNGELVIKVPGQDLVLGLMGPEPGAPVQAHPADGSPGQRWTLTPVHP